jgi:hypothetical protein
MVARHIGMQVFTNSPIGLSFCRARRLTNGANNVLNGINLGVSQELPGELSVSVAPAVS